MREQAPAAPLQYRGSDGQKQLEKYLESDEFAALAFACNAKQTRISLIIYLSVGTAVFLVIALTWYAWTEQHYFLIVVGIMIGSAIYASAALWQSLLRRLIHRHTIDPLKQATVPKILSHFGSFQYQPAPKAGTYDGILTNHLLPSNHSIHFEDYLTGTYRNQHLQAIEATATLFTNKVHVTVFHGLVVKIETPRERMGTYAIFSEFGHKPKFLGNGWKSIRLESDTFESLYLFVGTDEIEGRTIMTPRHMERLIQNDHFSFSQGLTAIYSQRNLYVALHRSNDWLFTTPAERDVSEWKEHIGYLAQDLETLFKAIDILAFQDAPVLDTPMGYRNKE